MQNILKGSPIPHARLQPTPRNNGHHPENWFGYAANSTRFFLTNFNGLVVAPLLLPSSVLTSSQLLSICARGCTQSPLLRSAKASQHMFSRVPLSSSVLEPMPLGDGIPSIVWALFGMTCCTSVDSGTTDGGLYEFLTYFVTVTLVFDSAPDPVGSREMAMSLAPRCCSHE